MFDKSPFDYASYDRWTEEIGELIVHFPLSVKYVCSGKHYSGRIVCQKGDSADTATITIIDCLGNPLPLNQFTPSIIVSDYEGNEVLILDAEITNIVGSLRVRLTVDSLPKAYYKMVVKLVHEEETIIAPSYGFIILSIV